MRLESFDVVRYDLGPFLQGQMKIPKLKSAYRSFIIVSTPLGGGHIIFAFSASCIRHAWFAVISRKSIYPIFTKFGMGVHWVNSLHGSAFGEDSTIAN